MVQGFPKTKKTPLVRQHNKKKAAKKTQENHCKSSTGKSSSLSQLDKTVTKYVNKRASQKILERATKMGEKFKLLGN